MQEPLELCNDLDSAADKLEKTPATEVNLETIKNTCAFGFRAISHNIRSAYEASRPPASVDPAHPPVPPTNQAAAAPTPATEGSTD